MEYNTTQYQEDVKEEKKEKSKVISGVAKKKKKTKGQRFLSLIIEDDVDSVKKYLISEVIIPSFKDMVSETISKGVDQLLFSGSGNSRNIYGSSSYSYYTSNKKKQTNYSSSSNQPVRRTNGRFEEVFLESRNDAIAVIEELQEQVLTYGETTVADYGQLVGLKSEYTDCNYGWTDVGYLAPIRRRQGWITGLLKPSPL